MLNTVSQLSR